MLVDYVQTFSGVDNNNTLKQTNQTVLPQFREDVVGAEFL